jgi:Fe-S-cluster containining protein
MSKVLGITTTEFTKKYCTTTNGLYHLEHPEKHCVFLENKRCKAYEGRPTQCRTWSFWPENMNAKTWNTEIAPFCPGVGKGKLYGLDEIKKILEEARAGDPSEPDVQT